MFAIWFDTIEAFRNELQLKHDLIILAFVCDFCFGFLLLFCWLIDADLVLSEGNWKTRAFVINQGLIFSWVCFLSFFVLSALFIVFVFGTQFRKIEKILP